MMMMATSLLSFLLILLAFSAPTFAIDGFWSIDCGGSKSFTSSNGIEWIGDGGDFVRTGESRSVPADPGRPLLPPELTTLRVFKSSRRKKYCYTIPVLKSTKVLARARFYYGNYDGLQRPPSFKLHFDTDEWATVDTTADTVQRKEAIYVTKSNGTSICLGRTHPDQDPFLSSLEVRTLTFDMYAAANASVVLLSVARLAFGASDLIRYKDDSYDRIWLPVVSDGFRIVDNNSTVIVNPNRTEHPPDKLFLKAATPPRGESNLTIRMADLPADPVPIYFNMYFSEMGADLNRSFDISVGGAVVSNISNPIKPVFRKVIRYPIVNQTASDRTLFTLVPRNDSALPPVISAMEVFMVKRTTEGTTKRDIFALSFLQDEFPILREWQGDPCLPREYNWDWVTCSSDPSPRITQLLLTGYGLSGPLPNLSALDALDKIDLHNNSLNGDIPEFLGYLPLLSELNLADNDFSSIPASLSQNKNIKLIISGNPKLCTSEQSCAGSTGRTATSSAEQKESKFFGLIFSSCFTTTISILGFL